MLPTRPPLTPNGVGVKPPIGTRPRAIIPQYSISSLREDYKNDASQEHMSLLLLGSVGSGKTTAIGTMPGPILVFSFDPSGTRSLKEMYPDRIIDPKSATPLAEQIASGRDIDLITKFEGLTEETATEKVKDWEKTFVALHTSGEIYNYRTVAIDSYSTLCMLYEWHQGLKDKTKNGNLPTLNDYGHINRFINKVITRGCSEPYHFIVTGHLGKQFDEATGKTIYQLKAYPSVRDTLPILFDFCFIQQATEKSDGIKYTITTHNPAFAAKKRSNNLSNVEPSDLTKIMKKIGGLKTEPKKLNA